MGRVILRTRPAGPHLQPPRERILPTGNWATLAAAEKPPHATGPGSGSPCQQPRLPAARQGSRASDGLTPCWAAIRHDAAGGGDHVDFL